MAKPRQQTRSVCELGPRTFAVWFGPKLALDCDPDEPLRHNRRVVAKVETDGRTAYYQGRVVTKNPTKAKRIAVRLNAGGLLRGASKEDLAPIVGEYRKRDFAIERVRKGVAP